MHHRLLAPAVAFCAVLAALPARAQSPGPLASTPIVLPPPPDELTGEQALELGSWVSAMQDWQRFVKKWHNESAHDAFGRIVARKPRPEPPAWLEARCAVLPGTFVAEPHDDLARGCRLFAGLEADLPAEAMRASTLAARADHERLEKNSFFSRVHLDGLWTTTSTDARLYGLIGSHISLVDVGRVQFFGPPGVIVVSVPNGFGARQLRVGYTWGMSVRLADVRVFGSSKNMTLFLSMTKCWLVGSRMDGLQVGGFDLAGFSLAPRKKR
jgi:hypothetical protein